jgi:hypothetical protein
MRSSIFRWSLIGLVVGGVSGWFGASQLATLHFLNSGESVNGWSYYLTFGRNQPPSLAAASGAKHGMFAHLPEEAVCYIRGGDASNGQAYTLHFDRSLDLHIQHNRPDDERVSNWLPAPDGQFRMLLRAYITGNAIRDGSYAPPPVTIAVAEGAD